MPKQLTQEESYYENYQRWQKIKKANIAGGVVILILLVVGLIMSFFF